MEPLDLVDYLDSTFLNAFLGDSEFCNSAIDALAFKGFKGILFMIGLSLGWGIFYEQTTWHFPWASVIPT